MKRFYGGLMLAAICTALAWANVGCQHKPRVVYLDDYFDSVGEQVAHAQIYTDAHVAEGVNVDEVIAALKAYLLNLPGHLTTSFDGEHPPLKEITGREYWALTLSQLNHKPLVLYFNDSPEQREAKIAEYLKSL